MGRTSAKSSGSAFASVWHVPERSEGRGNAAKPRPSLRSGTCHTSFAVLLGLGASSARPRKDAGRPSRGGEDRPGDETGRGLLGLYTGRSTKWFERADIFSKKAASRLPYRVCGLSLRALPRFCPARARLLLLERRGPKVELVLPLVFLAGQGYHLVGRDALHVEHVRDDPGARLELFELGDQPYVQSRE